MNGTRTSRRHSKPGARCPALRHLMVLILAAYLAGVPVKTAVSAPEGSGFPVPRFVSLRSGLANMRAGPGASYPITWVYQRRGLPLEIVAEFYHWRQVKDADGTLGWMHSSMLTGHRRVIVTAPTTTLHREPRADSPAQVRLEPGVVASVERCPSASAWCFIKLRNGVSGWTQRASLWGVYANETID